MSDWLKFFLVRLPVAMLAVAVVVEAAAWSLSGVTLHRHNVDDLANAVTHDQHPYKVVLMGDSVTHNVAHKFRIGEPGEVADLTTHAFAGLPSSLFLLKRYLESGHRPEHVVLAASVTVFVVPLGKSTFPYYVGSVFTRPDERAFLTRYYPDYVDYRWKPAALSISTKLGEPLFSLLRRPGNNIWVAPEAPPLQPVLENYADDGYDASVFKDKLNGPAVIRPEALAILGEMAALSRQYGFALHIIWAPMQTELRQALAQQGKVQGLSEQLASYFRTTGVEVSIDDSNERHPYPHFDRGYMHIKGLGWEQLYALSLANYIHGFEATAPRAEPGAALASVRMPSGTRAAPLPGQ